MVKEKVPESPLLKSIVEAEGVADKLLSNPEVLIDPSSSEAREIVETARNFAKLFFDAARLQSPDAVKKATADVPRLVVNGFNRDQIWEEMEIQNVPLRRHLRRALTKINQNSEASEVAKKEKKTVKDIGDDGRSSSKKKEIAKTKKVKKNNTPCSDRDGDGETDREGDDEDGVGATGGPLEDDFFSIKAMNDFADAAEKQNMRLDSDAEGDSDFNILDAADDDDGDENGKAKKAKFEDFFDPVGGGAKEKKKKVKHSKIPTRMEEEEEEEEEDDDEDEDEEEEEMQIGAGGDDLSDEEQELEAELTRLQNQQEDADEGSDDIDSEKNEDGKEIAKSESSDAENEEKPQSLYEMDKRLRQMEEEVQKFEEDQLNDKHWSLSGEVSAKQRPLNSLLELHVDQPMTNFAARRAEADAAASGVGDGANEDMFDDIPGAEALAKLAAGFDVDAVIRQRIWDEVFDDVVRKDALPPSQKPHGEDDTVETLDFQKSRVGLGDIYAKQYEVEMLGHKKEGEEKEDQLKAETKRLFVQLMFKLDQLTNAHFTPRPPVVSASRDLSKVASVKLEDTIPVMMSDAQLKAPEEERAPQRHDRLRTEFDSEEKAAARRRKKVGRKKELRDKLENYEMSLAGKRERANKLDAKNKAAKEEKKKQGQVVDAKRRIRSTELLSQAAASASNTISRKDAQREERKKRPDDTPASKKLKL